MKLRDLRYGPRPAWPPRWGGSYNRQDTFPVGEVGILKNVEPSGPGVHITIEVGGARLSATMLWEGSKPSPGEVVAALRPRIGTEIAGLGDVDVC